ncbi:hypothetical protein N9W57_00135 [Pseudomonadales bacterium]|nr:hypothetical protein [Pseudomonadales bacterium]
MDDEKIDNDEQAQKEDEIDFSPFLDYIQSEKGHAIVSRVLVVVEDLKKAGIETATSHAKLEKALQVVIILVVVGAASILTYHGKFDSTLGVLFGTLVGYLFGKK